MKLNKPTLCLSLVLASLNATSLAFASQPVSAPVTHALEYFRSEQMADGSFTKLTEVSSPLYAADMIFLYEYLDMADAKKDRIDRLMKGIWPLQKDTGGFSGYAGGEESIDITAAVYLAAKISGEPNESPRLQKMEAAIERMGGLGISAAGSLMHYMLMGNDGLANCFPSQLSSVFMKLDSKLPWEKVAIYPYLYLAEHSHFHHLDASKVPSIRPKGISCPSWTPHPLIRIFHSDKRFFRWLDANMNEDGTLFDFTPTTVPALMAMYTQGDRYKDQIALGLKTLENFAVDMPDGSLQQAPGEASVGESMVVLNALLDIEVPTNDPMMSKVADFIHSKQQPATGGFGFSKHNWHNPDSDDTAVAVITLKRFSLARNETPASNPKLDADLLRAIHCILTMQNKDGGFGTWDRETFLSKTLRKLGNMSGHSSMVFSQSVIEHSSRILLALSFFKDRSPEIEAAYNADLNWLLTQQNDDGSFQGAWFIDYLFGTSMVLHALSTAEDRADVRDASERALNFVLSKQLPDGGFGESPESFQEEEFVAAHVSSPAQTGLVMTQLMAFAQAEGFKHWNVMKPVMEKANAYLLSTQKSDGIWHDQTWTGVTFPRIEYSRYPYIQEISPVEALGLYTQSPQ